MVSKDVPYYLKCNPAHCEVFGFVVLYESLWWASANLSSTILKDETLVNSNALVT
jgi:hypothetical protein